jgi:hypothetical protein
MSSARGSFWGAHHYARRLGMTAASLDIQERVMLWKTYVSAQLTHKLPFLTTQQVDKLQADVNRSLRITFGEHASPTALHIELNIQPLSISHAVSIARLYGRLQAADTNFQFSAVHSILMAEQKHTHKYSLRQRQSLSRLHLDHHFPYIHQTLLPPPTRARDILAQRNPRPCQSPLAPSRHNWDLLLQAQAKAETRQTYISWTQDKEHRGSEYRSLTSKADHKRIGITKPSWTQLGLRRSNNSKLLLIRIMAIDLMCHSKLLDSKHTHISAETAFCPLCFAQHTQGPTQEHADNTLHALFYCPQMLQERTALQQHINGFLECDPLYFKKNHSWTPCSWSTFSTQLKLLILLGAPLHKSSWGSTHQPIKVWQRNFLYHTTPMVWSLLQTKARRGTAVPSGA